ncbi:hypothetical protein CFP56_006808 [Quercus suber]|uniref:RNase H type-1 domain-containing protein n=1 Tax=Quercus suber TaxID=58331 RepID=A0AAW0M765_QUESU
MVSESSINPNTQLQLLILISKWIGLQSCLRKIQVINLFSKPSYTNRLTQPIVNDCRNMLQAFQEYRMQHYFRETNRAACLQILAAAKLNLLFLM